MLNKPLIPATGVFTHKKFGNQFVLDGALYNYIKETNTYVDARHKNAYKDSGYDPNFLSVADPYAYKYGTSTEGKAFFEKQLGLPF